ncbi:hypothetical protein B0H10DRAFT_1939265 [Mycena sp. CBHHK59/15]|nr:hypothetical protein B0H10DRAFT_1939265 [Mycena sp. CBHHK59/15]
MGRTNRNMNAYLDAALVGGQRATPLQSAADPPTAAPPPPPAGPAPDTPRIAFARAPSRATRCISRRGRQDGASPRHIGHVRDIGRPCGKRGARGVELVARNTRRPRTQRPPGSRSWRNVRVECWVALWDTNAAERSGSCFLSLSESQPQEHARSNAPLAASKGPGGWPEILTGLAERERIEHQVEVITAQSSDTECGERPGQRHFQRLRMDERLISKNTSNAMDRVLLSENEIEDAALEAIERRLLCTQIGGAQKPRRSPVEQKSENSKITEKYLLASKTSRSTLKAQYKRPNTLTRVM